MINLIIVIAIIIIELLFIHILFSWQKEKYELEITKRDRTVSNIINKIKMKNKQIKELQDDLKRTNNKRLR